jgi:hypothetical protein
MFKYKAFDCYLKWMKAWNALKVTVMNWLQQYFDDTFPTTKEQKAFERNLFNKTHRANAEIIMLDGLTCVYRSSVDLYFYVMGSSNENGVSLSNFEAHKCIEHNFNE